MSEDRDLNSSSEDLVLRDLSLLLQNQRSRYEEQASKILESGSLSVTTKVGEIRYWIKGRRIHYSLIRPSDGTFHEGEAPLPFMRKRKVDEFVFFFAQSEAIEQN
jgi:hypothetical protein